MRVVASGLTRRYPVDPVATVKELLRRLPTEHVLGIDSVVISGADPIDEREPQGVMGQYFEAWEGEPAAIVLYPEEMAEEVPRLLRGIPHVWRLLFAQTLFHEVGHHYQKFTHGIRRDAQEDHAEAYGHRHARRVFPVTYRLLDRWRGVRRFLRRMRLHRLARRRAAGRAGAEDLYELGRLYWGNGNWDAVVLVWEDALRVDPGHADVRRWLPQARRRLREEAAARARGKGARSGRLKTARKRRRR